MGTGGMLLRKVRAAASDRPTGFVWVIPGRLAASGYPASKGQVAWLRRQGVNAILTLTEEPLPEGFRDGQGIEFGHVPLVDHMPPDPEALRRGADFIRKKLGEGKTVSVHCLAGEGRTGTVLAAYLIEEEGLSTDEALTKLRAVKKLFVERSQEQAVRAFDGSFRRRSDP